MVEQMDLFACSVSEEVVSKKITEDDLQKAHDKKYTQKLMTPQEWELYRLIKYNSEVLDRRTSQKEIAEKLGLKWNSSETCHDHCPKVWTLIEHINLSGETEKVIISFQFEYWIGNENETKVYLDKLWNDLAPRLSRFWIYTQKAKRDGQGKLLSTQLKPIDDSSSAREYVESYLNKGE